MEMITCCGHAGIIAIFAEIG